MQRQDGDGAEVELRAALVGGALAVEDVASRLRLPLFRVLSRVGVNTNSSSFSAAPASPSPFPGTNQRPGPERRGESKRPSVLAPFTRTER